MKLKNSKVLLGAATVAAAVAGAGHQAQAATTSIGMSAVILAPVQITAVKALDFGSATVAAATSGTITVDQADSRIAGGAGGVSLVGGAANAQSGDFKIIASTGKQVAVTAPATATVAAGPNIMVVGNFDINAAGAGNTYVHTQVAATDAGLKLGGTLTVGAAQAPGTYTGTVTLTANYQ